MKIFMLDGTTFVVKPSDDDTNDDVKTGWTLLEIDESDIAMIEGQKQVLLHTIEHLMNKVSGATGQFYSFFIPGNEAEVLLSISIDVPEIFALPTSTDPYRIHKMLRHKEYNDLSTKVLLRQTYFDQYDDEGFTMLYIACDYGNFDMVDILIHGGANSRQRCTGMISPYDMCEMNSHINPEFRQILTLFDEKIRESSMY
jgi:hypothetical protein